MSKYIKLKEKMSEYLSDRKIVAGILIVIGIVMVLAARKLCIFAWEDHLESITGAAALMASYMILAVVIGEGLTNTLRLAYKKPLVFELSYATKALFLAGASSALFIINNEVKSWVLVLLSVVLILIGTFDLIVYEDEMREELKNEKEN